MAGAGSHLVDVASAADHSINTDVIRIKYLRTLVLKFVQGAKISAEQKATMGVFHAVTAEGREVTTFGGLCSKSVEGSDERARCGVS